jgi:hypothetical protein
MTCVAPTPVIDIPALVSRGADILVQYNRGALPLYDAQGQSFDVLGHVRALQTPNEVAEWIVWVHPPEGEPLRGRLCALRLSDDKAEKAFEHARREQGNKLSAASLEAAAWILLFTTVSRSRMKTRRALALYPMRWQVKLEIKRDESLGGVSKLPNFRPDTIATWLQAKLLIQLVAKKIASLAETFPPPSPTGTFAPSRTLHPPPSACASPARPGVSRASCTPRFVPRCTSSRYIESLKCSGLSSST